MRLSRTAAAERVADLATQVLADAAKWGSVAVVETLLAFGADPDAATPEGRPLENAVRAGQPEIVSVLTDHGATSQVSVVNRFLGACSRGARNEAERLLAQHPDLAGQFSEADRAAIVEAAAHQGTDSVALMLDLGFSADARNDLGETALHTAAYEGRAETVRLLIDRRADIDARDGRFDSTPLAFATVGSGERPNSDGDWAETVRVLLDAGAGRDEVWISEKPPSPQVAVVLQAYGVTEDETGNESGDETGNEGSDWAGDEVRDSAGDEGDEKGPDESVDLSSSGAGLLREVAERIRAAYDTADLELFASLLHPDVQWGGGPNGCSNRAQVLARYQDQLSRGVRAQVATSEVHGGAVITGLAVARPAEGARPLPPDVTYQVFGVSDGLIVSITGFEDLAAARAAGTQPGNA